MACKHFARGLQTFCTRFANRLHRACKYSAQGPVKELHAACEYTARGLRICLTWPANTLHRVCKSVAQGLQIRCTVFVNMVHKACKYAAQGLQICCTVPAQSLQHSCTGPTNILHLRLHICCTGPAPIFHRAPNMLHKSRKYVLREACRYAAQGLPTYAARSLQI